MVDIVDRRKQGGKSHGNRERFLRRYKDQVRKAVGRAIDKKGIRDIGQNEEEVRIPKRDMNEPTFGHGQGGRRDMVHPGNKEYERGDRIERPKGGQGQGSGKGQASDSGEGEDDFVFSLSKEEFMDVFFQDLALPNLERTILAQTPEYRLERAGIVTEGTPANLSLVRSKRQQISRRIAMTSGRKKERDELQEELDQLNRDLERFPEVERHVRDRIAFLTLRIERLNKAITLFSRLDPEDLRYRSRRRVPIPISKAVMFCLMDVSGSMDEERKDLAKRFFILLYLFLTRHYERIDLVFIRHHTQAQEVDEETFFNARETGGTVVSSALVLMEEVIRARYDPAEWNIYGAQSSDGDNWHHDSGRCAELLTQKLLPLCRYYAYIQVAEEEQNLWEEYVKVAQRAEHKGRFAMRKALARDQIYPVFRDLFQKEQSK